MGSKELKTALKAAREAIRNKEFKEALKQCKVALAEDKNNYNALVFVGVAAEGLEQYEQALKAYRRAAEISPEQLLAWQGLSSMGAKNPGLIGKEELVGVLEKLIDLYDTDKEKRLDCISKLIAVYGKSDMEKIVPLYEKALKDCTPGSTRNDLLLQFVVLLCAQQALPVEWEAMFYSGLEELLFTGDVSVPRDQQEELVQAYLALLRKREPETLYERCSQLVPRYPSLPVPLETKLCVLLDRQMGSTNTSEVEEIRNLVSSLAQLTEGKTSAELLQAKGFLALKEGNLVVAQEYLQQGVSSKPMKVCGHFYLAQVLFRLHRTANCMQSCEKALSLLSSKPHPTTVSVKEVKMHLHLMMAQCCHQQGTKHSLSQALAILDEIQTTSEDLLVLRASILLDLEDVDKFLACLEKFHQQDTAKVKVLLAQLDFFNKDYSAAASKLRQCISEDQNNAQYLLKLGKALWELRNDGGGPKVQEECFNTLLKAAKLDPYLSDAFLYLGYFYTQLKKDQERGKKCYQKAFDLDPNNDRAGAALCDLLTFLGEEESVKSLLLKVTGAASAGCAKWAWLRLGLAEMKSGDLSTAISSLQSALRADPADRHVWECLAEAYLLRGSFTAALKAFGKAAELDPDSVYCLYQLASIKQRIGELTEAAAEYRLILDKSPHYVPALKGLGETQLLLAKQQLQQYLLGLAQDSCQQAIHLLTKAAARRPDLSCLWKLIGDCCCLLHPLQAASFSISVPKRLCETTARDDADRVQIGKMEMLQLGSRCYGRALKILPDSATLWHDLGVSFLYQCRDSVACEEHKQLAEKCITALKKAVTLDPSNHMHWTALGVAAASPYVNNPTLAQHSFIKSIQSEARNSVAWTNLGTLYLINDNIKLAHEAFKVAQSQDPEYVASWVGQALIAEFVGHEEAMDLFRHTTELGIHLESCIGYGHWVISTLLDVTKQNTEAFQYCIHQMSAVPAAADALIRYTSHVKTDPAAYNMLGLLLEHQGLVRPALHAFEKAVQLLGETKASGEEQNKIGTNLARLLGKNGRCQEAAAMFESCGVTSSFADLCQWGLVLYQSGQLQESLKIYQQALATAESDADKSEVCAALGMVAFKLGDVDGAKSALFQGYQASTPSLQGLIALCALGLLQGDTTLTQATLQELSALNKKEDRLEDVMTLTAFSKVLQGDASEAVTAVRQVLEGHADVAGLCLLMAQLSLLCTGDGHLAETCSRQALSQGKASEKRSLVCLALSQMHLGKHSRQTARDSAFRTAQKAFHANPDDISSLCCLVSSVHSEAVIQYAVSGDRSLLSKEVSLLDMALTSAKITTDQLRWCLKQQAVAHIMLNDMAAAEKTLQQITKHFTQESDFVGVMDCVLRKNQAALEPLVIRDGTKYFFWQVLLVSLVQKQQWTEAGIVLREALQRAAGDSTQQVQIASLLHIALMAAHQLLESGSDPSGDNSTLLAELEEAGQALEQLTGQPHTVVQLLQALVHFQHNPRKAKHHFANVLDPELPPSNLMVDLSIARRGVILLLHASQKDPELIQKLLSEAEHSADTATVNFYKKLQG